MKAEGWSKGRNGVHSFHCEVCAIDVNVFISSFSAGVSGSLGPRLVVGGDGVSPFSNGVAVIKGVGNIPWDGYTPKGYQGRSHANKHIGKAEEL